MPTSADNIKKWIEEWEGPTLDFKLKDILSDNHKIAKLMVAFGNNKFVSEDFGGIIVIGVNNETKDIEGLEYDPKHEEHIMNIARDKCTPSINPNFEKVDVDGKTVYVITIPKMTSTPYQQITREGNVHWIRVGSTIRQPTFNELSSLYTNSSENETEIEKTQIVKSIPPVYEAYRRLIVIPIDANTKILHFDKSTMEILGKLPQFMNISRVELKQNEVHYHSHKGEKDYHSYGIINDLGTYCFQEAINENKTIVIGREIVFIISLLNYISFIYKKFGYNGHLKIKYQLEGVQNYPFTKAEVFRSAFIEHTCQLPRVNIERTISISTLEPKKLCGSILLEIARACNWPLDDGSFDQLIEETLSKVGMK